MDVQEVFRFMDGERLGVLTTATNSGQPQAALMGFAVTPDLEIIFDTVRTSRKYPNMKENPRVAWVVGCTTKVTVQYEGEAEELEGTVLAKYKPIYFRKFPDGPTRENWAGMTYFLVRPKWVRYCDYNPESRRIEEHRF
ncbi:MAG TPA: pyridoxamine 5'-phosphate oxidase family protein [Candidatus Acidoferrum sp.]|nr:pyridoxamine 5'-phosphate oxidase family protein [Candidatus Acidoferrum sp.]